MADIGESGNAVLQTIQASEGGRALRLLRQRQQMRDRMQEAKEKIESKGLRRKNLTFGGSTADRLEEQFKKETIGLVTAEAFKEKRARLEEQIRVEQKSLFPQKLQEKRRMELRLSTSKLSFGGEEVDEVVVQLLHRSRNAAAAAAAAEAAAAAPLPAPISAASHAQQQQQHKKEDQQPLHKAPLQVVEEHKNIGHQHHHQLQVCTTERGGLFSACTEDSSSTTTTCQKKHVFVQRVKHEGDEVVEEKEPETEKVATFSVNKIAVKTDDEQEPVQQKKQGNDDLVFFARKRGRLHKTEQQQRTAVVEPSAATTASAAVGAISSVKTKDQDRRTEQNTQCSFSLEVGGGLAARDCDNVETPAQQKNSGEVKVENLDPLPPSHSSGEPLDQLREIVDIWPRKRRIGKDPTVDTNFLPDEERDAKVIAERKRLIEEYQRIEAEACKEPLWVTYSFWDGTGHRRRTCVTKGSTVLQFLDKARNDLEKEFVELRGLTGVDLMYIKEDLILPHSTTFYELIKTKARGKSGPLFNFNVHEDVRMVNDSRMEKEDSHAGKVVERKWFERNKHIFPASRWEVYNPNKTYDTYTIHGGVHKWKGISNNEIRDAVV